MKITTAKARGLGRGVESRPTPGVPRRVRLVVAACVIALCLLLPTIAVAATPMQQEAWLSSAAGRYMDVDGYPSGGKYQCVDVADDYCNAMFGDWRGTLGGGDAGLGLLNASPARRESSFTKFTNNVPGRFPQRGDIVFWSGHVAVVESADASGMWVMEQNYPNQQGVNDGLQPCRRWRCDYKSVIGWLRPKMDPPALTVVGAVSLSPGPYEVGKAVSGSFTVQNTGGQSGTWAPLVLALRGPKGENRDAAATSYLVLAPGASTKVHFSRQLDLAGNWTGSVSGRLLSNNTWASPAGATVAFPVKMPTGTLRVNLKYDDWNYAWYAPHINAGTIHVYGPSGYYRSARFGGTGSAGKVVGYTFTEAPIGPYRVRVVWDRGYDSAAQESNQYFTTSLSALNSTRAFGSP